MGASGKKSIGNEHDGLILEAPCKRCDGQGFIRDSIEIEGCGQCGGSGYATTELGQRVLDLMRNNFKVLMCELIGGEER